MQVFADNVRTQLVSITGSALQVVDGLSLPAADRGIDEDSGENSWFKLVLTNNEHYEIVYVHTHSAGSNAMSNVLRGQDGTTQRAWAPEETTVMCTPTAGDMARFEALKWADAGIKFVAYESRGALRSDEKGSCVVDGLGLFLWESGSTEPDDDESCFATATGRWLLQAAHWDLIDAWQLPEVEERDAYDEDEPLRFASKVITGSIHCAITALAGNSSVSFSVTLPGARVGDGVIATPPAQLGADAVNTARLGWHAWVNAANTVTVTLTNNNANGSTLNTAVQAAWSITVIKP